MEGSFETACKGTETRTAQDRRVYLVVMELGRYQAKIAALEETKWLGTAVYRVGESVILATGQSSLGFVETR